MPKTKKKKPDRTKSKNLAFAFSIVDIGILLIAAYSVLVLNIDKFTAIGVWLFITICFAVFLWFYDQRAANIFLDAFGDGRV